MEDLANPSINNQEVAKSELTEKVEKVDRRKTMPHLFKEGQSGNPGGRPKGAKGFSTLFEAAVKKIAAEKKIDIKDPETELVIKAILEGLRGNYPFFRDLMDRQYGKPKEQLEIENKGLPFMINIIQDDRYTDKNG